MARWGGAAGGGDPPAPDLRRSESATTAAGTAPLRRRDQAPRADRASRPGRSRGFTRSIVPEPRSGGGAGGVGSHAGGRRARAPGLRAGEAGGSEVRWVLRTPAGGRAGVGAARLWRERRPHLPRLSPRAAGGERTRRACGAPVLSFSPQSRFGPVAPAGGRRVRSAPRPRAGAGSWLERPRWGRRDPDRGQATHPLAVPLGVVPRAFARSGRCVSCGRPRLCSPVPGGREAGPEPS